MSSLTPLVVHHKMKLAAVKIKQCIACYENDLEGQCDCTFDVEHSTNN